MRSLVIFPVIAGLSMAGLAGCTSAQEEQSLAAISVGCTALGVGSAIAINVASSGAAAALTTVIGGDVSKSCDLIIAGTQSAIERLTSAGQTATVTVTSSAHNTGARQSLRFRAQRVEGRMVYIFPPN